MHTLWIALAALSGLHGSWNRTDSSVVITATEVRYTRTFPGYRFQWRADYRLPEGLEERKALPIDFTLRELTGLAESEAVAERFNREKFCGLEGWTAGQPRDISGRICAGNQLAREGYQAYGTLKLDGDRLFADFDAASPKPESRPRAESSTFYVRGL